MMTTHFITAEIELQKTSVLLQQAIEAELQNTENHYAGLLQLLMSKFRKPTLKPLLPLNLTQLHQ
jgi:hypothetical protein